MYEICPHPYHTLQKVYSAMARLDNITRLLKCLSVDAGNPMVSRFDEGAALLLSDTHKQIVGDDLPHTQGDLSNAYGSSEPLYLQPAYVESSGIVNEAQLSTYQQVQPPPPDATQVANHSHDLRKHTGCVCTELALLQESPDWKKHVPLWDFTPRWPATYEPGEIQREEARRIVWANIQVMASFQGQTATLGTDVQQNDYWTGCAENVSSFIIMNSLQNGLTLSSLLSCFLVKLLISTTTASIIVPLKHMMPRTPSGRSTLERSYYGSPAFEFDIRIVAL